MPALAQTVYLFAFWVRAAMGLIRNVVILGIAKKVYDESRKPENQRKIRETVANFKTRQGRTATSDPR